jgi:hypothetical protein
VSGVTVEEVRRADQRRRFHELGRVLFADEPRWAPVLRPYEAWLFERRHPYHQRAEVVRFLARREGTVVGRICAHLVSGADDAWFGAFESADDPTAVRGLVQAASEWARERGAMRVRGPATFTSGDEAGVLVAGFEHAGGTARPWHPPWYAAHLRAAGLADDDRTFPRWRLLVDRAPAGSIELREDSVAPPQAGKLGDRRLALSGPAGSVAAVPDISGTLRTTSLRSARLRLEAVSEASVVRVDGDPDTLVPALLRAAAVAGYEVVWTPWSPDDRPPDTVHQLLATDL